MKTQEQINRTYKTSMVWGRCRKTGVEWRKRQWKKEKEKKERGNKTIIQDIKKANGRNATSVLDFHATSRGQRENKYGDKQQGRRKQGLFDEEAPRFLLKKHSKKGNINGELETATKTPPSNDTYWALPPQREKKKKTLSAANHDESTHTFAGQEQMEQHKCAFLPCQFFFLH